MILLQMHSVYCGNDKDDNVSFYHSGDILILSVPLKITMEIQNNFLRVRKIVTFIISIL